MYADDKDDWKILKESKVARRNKLEKRKNELAKKSHSFVKNKAQAEPELAELQAAYDKAHHRQKANYRFKLKQKQTYVDNLTHDIHKAKELINEYNTDLIKLKEDIKEIDEKIRLINQKNSEKSQLACSEANDPVQECPKKCRISNVKLTCSHNGRTMEVFPKNFENGETPEFHVLAGTAQDAREIVEVSFDGSCDHGKSQQAPDSGSFKVANRTSNADNYCPRVQIQSNDNINTAVNRPANTKFIAQPSLEMDNSSPLKFLVNKLIFGQDAFDTYEYDLTFDTCKGQLPYTAKVVSHPKSSWNLEFTCGYKTEFSTENIKNDQLKDYNAVTTSGKWESKIVGKYTYDKRTQEIEQTLELKELFNQVGKWPVIADLADFFAPISALLENAAGYSKVAEDKYKEEVKKQAASKKFVKPYKPASFEILWPNLKLTGSYQRAELTKDKGGSFGIGGEGKLAAEFSPLIGLTGKIDLMQYFLMTLGGAFGEFLRKIAKLSIGKKDEFGELDKKRSYIQTNLELLLGFTSNVGGNLTFTNLNGQWKGSEGSGVTGFIGLIFEGKAKVDGKVWRVTFGAGAEFKTTDESGSKNCGIEVSLKSIAIDNRFALVGLTEFTGLAITWAFILTQVRNQN